MPSSALASSSFKSRKLHQEFCRKLFARCQSQAPTDDGVLLPQFLSLGRWKPGGHECPPRAVGQQMDQPSALPDTVLARDLSVQAHSILGTPVTFKELLQLLLHSGRAWLGTRGLLADNQAHTGGTAEIVF